ADAAAEDAVAEDAAAPYVLCELVLGHYFASVSQQISEHIKRLVFDLDGLAVDRQFVGNLIEYDPAKQPAPAGLAIVGAGNIARSFPQSPVGHCKNSSRIHPDRVRIVAKLATYDGRPIRDDEFEAGSPIRKRRSIRRKT